MIANLIAFNAVEGKTSSGSVEFSGNQNDVIQLMINGYKYIFDNTGKLQYSSETETCMSNAPKATCASIPDNGVCIPNPHFTPYD
jgi:hypothetical protein